jgi:2',3'-cyclic-nucleotide 2'-phosphodiesterase
MPNNRLRVILIGDVIGRYGREFVACTLPLVRRRFQPDLVVANGENCAGGIGIVPRTANELFNAGVDLLTGGNHIFDKKEARALLSGEPRVLRPLNFPAAAPGNGFATIETGAGPVTVVSLQGRVFMEAVADNPFIVMDEFLKTRRPAVTVVDFHAEASAEKQGLGFFLEGRVAAVLGTHTHVPTADARLLPGGTAYQTDVGMTGSLDSIIGMERAPIIEKYLTGVGQRFEVAKERLIQDLTVVDIDPATGRALAIEALRLYHDRYEQQLAT